MQHQHTPGKPIDDDPSGCLRRWHRIVLIGSCAVVAAAFLMDVLPEGRVAVRGLERFPLPHTCLSRILFDGRCPGCGLSRSFIYLSQARWNSSFAVHRVGWLLAMAVVLQIPYRAIALLGRRPRPLGQFIPTVFGWSLAGLLIGNWLYDCVAFVARLV